MRRIMAGLVVAFLILTVAVTPLSATYQPGYFDLLLASPNRFDPSIRVTLKDDTGLVMAFVDAEGGPLGEPGKSRFLIVDWEGDSDDSGLWLHFFAIDGGYQLVEMATQFEHRAIGTGIGHRFVLILRAPVDPSTVEVVNS
jgi:hypothetical protein